MLTNEHKDIIARALAGLQGGVVNAAYLEFTNGAVPSVEATAALGSSYYQDLVTTSGTSGLDILRVPLVGVARTASDPKYLGDVLNFNITSSGSLGVGGLEFSADAGSQVYGLALVAAPVWADHTQDLVFAREYDDITPVPKVGSQQIHFSWRYRA